MRDNSNSMQMRAALASLALGGAFTIPSLASAQAFGVAMGAPPSRYGGRLVDPDDPTYFSIAVPQPNGEFESYNAISTPETGICRISGLGRDHDNDPTGAATMPAYNAMKRALEAKYGPSQSYDFLVDGATWDQPNEWVWSLFKKERTVASFWIAGEGGAQLPPAVASISLEITAINASSAYITIRYEFKNFDRCQAILQQVKYSSL